MATLPSPPFHHVEGLPNFRDIGGYPLASDPRRVVRQGIVFRSAEPSRLTDAGVDELRRIGVTRVYDLRSRTEVDAQPPRKWDGAEHIFAPVFHDVEAGPAALALRLRRHADLASQGPAGFSDLYFDFFNAGSAPSRPDPPFRSILAQLAAPETSPLPLLVHCTAGKDRTGIICAVILSICGVADDVVAHEYSLTDLGLRERHEELLRYLLSHDEFQGNAEAAKQLITSRKESMLATLGRMRETYGSVENCVKERCELSDEDIERIRSRMIVDVSEDQPVVDWKLHAKLV